MMYGFISVADIISMGQCGSSSVCSCELGGDEGRQRLTYASPYIPPPSIFTPAE